MCNVYMRVCMRLCMYIRMLLSDVLLCSYYNSDDISVCYTSCNGYENELTSCYIKSDYCSSCDVVGITCGKYIAN